jgi:hypothetical protein
MIDSNTLYTNQPVRTKKNNLPVVIGAVIIIIVLVGGFIMFRQSKKTVPPKVVVVNQEPSPTEMPKIDKSTVKIQVQNGTGTPGQAGTAVDALKKAGYNSDNIKTANAKDFTSTVTTITTKAGFEATASDIKTSLGGVFTDINIDPAKLDTTSAFDIVVVTGGKKFEVTPTTTVAPSQNPTPTTNTNATPSPTSTLAPTPTLSPTPIP